MFFVFLDLLRYYCYIDTLLFLFSFLCFLWFCSPLAELIYRCYMDAICFMYDPYVVVILKQIIVIVTGGDNGDSDLSNVRQIRTLISK
jgi:hypothetical protein